jgi:hypothetical protein
MSIDIDTIMGTTQEPTGEQLTRTLSAMAAVAEAIARLGSVPSGVLYAQVCGAMDLSAYNSVIALLKRAGLVAEKGHVLTWSGPDIR